jgi:hypothetical protein
MNRRTGFVVLSLLTAVSVGAVEIASPGFPSSRLEQDGRLIEDWGAPPQTVDPIAR